MPRKCICEAGRHRALCTQSTETHIELNNWQSNSYMYGTVYKHIGVIQLLLLCVFCLDINSRILECAHSETSIDGLMRIALCVC